MEKEFWFRNAMSINLNYVGMKQLFHSILMYELLLYFVFLLMIHIKKGSSFFFWKITLKVIQRPSGVFFPRTPQNQFCLEFFFLLQNGCFLDTVHSLSDQSMCITDNEQLNYIDIRANDRVLEEYHIPCLISKFTNLDYKEMAFEALLVVAIWA